MKKFSFDKNYFLKGPYKNISFSGWKKYFSQYYWARRYYALLTKKLKKQGRLLEIGCGFGDLLSFLENDFESYGIDISKEAIKEAKTRTEKSNLSVMRAEELDSFKKNFFDIIIACHVLEHLQKPDSVIEKISQILKKDGLFLMAVPNPESIGKKLKKQKWVGYRDKTHISLFSPKKWLTLLKKNSLAPMKVFSDGLWDAPYLPFIPSFFQKIIFSFPAGIQTISGLSFLPIAFGESLIVLAKK